MPNINIQVFLVTMAAVLPSLTIHEFAHAFAAYKFGDNTAKDMGRLTLNPIAHIDWFGTIVLPLLIGFGYAKPVPVNFSLLTRAQMLFVAIAGPLSNILLATVLAILYHILPVENIKMLKYFLLLGIQLNVVFAVFNLIPIPPLDGSRVVYASLKNEKAIIAYRHFSRFGIFILIGLLYLGGVGLIIDPMLNFFFKLYHLS